MGCSFSTSEVRPARVPDLEAPIPSPRLCNDAHTRTRRAVVVLYEDRGRTAVQEPFVASGEILEQRMRGALVRLGVPWQPAEPQTH